MGEVENQGNKQAGDTRFYQIRFDSGQDAYVTHRAIERTIGTIEPQIFERDPGQIQAETRKKIEDLARELKESEKIEAVRKKTEEEAARREAANRSAAKKAEQKRIAEQRARPDAKIGMTQDQVVTGTHWGRPLRINKTATARGVREQWVYGDGGYLYFENNLLTAIQTSR